MIKLIKNLWSILSYKRKKQAISLLLFSVITSVFEVLTVGSIFNLLSLISKPTLKEGNETFDVLNIGEF